MKILISNFGFMSGNCDDDYEPAEGEAVFDAWPTEEQMLIAFPGRPAYIEMVRIQEVSESVRAERDNLLRTVYDSGTQMIRRELETEPLDPVYATKLLAKRTELHAYARLLQAVPEQAGFPDSVVWPEQPSEELE